MVCLIILRSCPPNIKNCLHYNNNNLQLKELVYLKLLHWLTWNYPNCFVSLKMDKILSHSRYLVNNNVKTLFFSRYWNLNNYKTAVKKWIDNTVNQLFPRYWINLRATEKIFESLSVCKLLSLFLIYRMSIKSLDTSIYLEWIQISILYIIPPPNLL